MSEKTLALVGNWHYIPGPRGYSVYSFDEETAKLNFIGTFFDDLECGQQVIDAERKLAFVVNESSGQHGDGGDIVSFSFNDETFEPQLINRVRTFSNCPCYLSLDKSKKFLVAVHHAGQDHVTKIVKNELGECSSEILYNDAPVELFRINENGSIGELCDYLIPEIPENDYLHTHSILHSVFCDPQGEIYTVLDSGLDKVYTFRIDRENGCLIKLYEQAVPDGSSPRYGAFHPSLPFFYVNNEKKAVVYTFTYDKLSGHFEQCATTSIQTMENSGKATEASDMLISDDGRFLYISDRGSDFIAVLSIQPNGIPKLIDNIPCGGKNPRGLCFSPDKKYLLVTNSDTPNISIFKIDENGLPDIYDEEKNVACPASIKFLKI